MKQFVLKNKQLNYIKVDFVQKHLDDIINIKLFENLDKNEYHCQVHLNYKHNYKKIHIKNMNYKLYYNLFDWIFENNWKFPFQIPIKELKDNKINVIEI